MDKLDGVGAGFVALEYHEDKLKWPVWFDKSRKIFHAHSPLQGHPPIRGNSWEEIEEKVHKAHKDRLIAEKGDEKYVLAILAAKESTDMKLVWQINGIRYRDALAPKKDKYSRKKFVESVEDLGVGDTLRDRRPKQYFLPYDEAKWTRVSRLYYLAHKVKKVIDLETQLWEAPKMAGKNLYESEWTWNDKIDKIKIPKKLVMVT